MRILLFTVLILCGPVLSFASELKCESWYQENGQALQKFPMSLVGNTADNMIFESKALDYNFKVDWNKGLTTFYIFIESAGKRILFTTARVPTEDHPENFTDLNIPAGPRLTVNCEMK